jgi:hypothetical protein
MHAHEQRLRGRRTPRRGGADWPGCATSVKLYVPLRVEVEYEHEGGGGGHDHSHDSIAPPIMG